jgi:hypothetical protein
MMVPMISIHSQFLRRSIGTVALVAALIGCFAATSPASARFWVGFGFPGIYVGPPVYPYYYPPAYYPPPAMSYAPGYAPPQGYTPPQGYAPSQAGAGPGQSGQICNAGSYTCPMDQPVASGSACYCLGNGGAHMWGHAN